jgi:hypothetical protein
VYAALAQYIEATIIRRHSSWQILCKADQSHEKAVPVVEVQQLIDKLHSGEFRAQKPFAPGERRLAPSDATARKRKARRTPEEIKAEWDEFIESGIARPADARDNPDVYSVPSVQHLFCNPCGEVVPGTGSNYNWCASSLTKTMVDCHLAACPPAGLPRLAGLLTSYVPRPRSGNFTGTHSTKGTHKEAIKRFKIWEAMLTENGTVALRVADDAGVNGFSILHVQCAICPSISGDGLMIITGNQTRYNWRVNPPSFKITQPLKIPVARCTHAGSLPSELPRPLRSSFPYRTL